jgi:predicted SAM-dependent methyltransferase
MQEPLKLDLGCGPWKKKGFYGIDIKPMWVEKELKVDADLIHDLNTGIPFEDNSIEEIWASQFMEHVSNIYFMLDECWRVLMPDKILEIIVPLYEVISVDHITMFYPDWFDNNICLPQSRYMGKFKIIEKEIYYKDIAIEKRGLWNLRIKLQAIK